MLSSIAFLQDDEGVSYDVKSLFTNILLEQKFKKVDVSLFETGFQIVDKTYYRMYF